MRQHHTSTRRTALLLVAGLLGLLATAPVTADDTLERGIAAYEAERFEKAYELLKPLADEGDAEAQFYVGRMYSFGRGVEQDRELGIRTSYRAAKQGQPQAQRTIGYVYYEGILVEQDHEEAAKWYRRAAEAGDPAAQRSMGLRYKNGEGVERDYERAAAWFRRAAQQGDKQAQTELGRILWMGRGDVRRDRDEAMDWYREAAERGYDRGQYFYCSAKIRDVSARSDAMVDALKWCKLAADQGHTGGQQNWDAAGRWFLTEEQLEEAEARAEAWSAKQ